MGVLPGSYKYILCTLDTWNRLTAAGLGGGHAGCMKDGEGINQRTFMYNPWARTKNVGIGLGWRARVGEGGKDRKVGTTVTV